MIPALVHSSTLTIVLCFLLSFVQSTPTKVPDSKTLCRNGQQAQELNTQFKTLKATDSCNKGEKACISGAVVACRNGTWEDTPTKCSKSQQCFALPSNVGEGVLVTCTAKDKALSAFQAAGVTGGIFSATAGNTTTTNQDNERSGKDPKFEADKNKDEPANDIKKSPVRPTKTITVTLGPKPTTLTPITRTLTPQEAYSELLNIMKEGATIVGGSLPTFTSRTP